MNAGYFDKSSDNDRPVADTSSENGRSAHPSSDGAILLIDDNPAVAGAMEIAFRMAGRRLHAVTSPEEALSRLASRRFDAILLDMNFTAGRSNGDEGMALLSRIMCDDPSASVIVITAHSGIRIAVAAMQAGARDFLMKPWRNSELIAKVEAAIIRAGQVSTVPARANSPVALLGESTAMTALRDLVRRVASTTAGVTIAGLPGSGRMHTAMAVHAMSPHSAGEPLRIDLRDENAWVDLKDIGDTIILRHPDQLNEIAQTRLLDRLPHSARPIAIVDDIRTLTPALRRRIATVEITIPPLAEREGDGVLLARHFARLAAERFGRPAPRLTFAAEQAIAATIWTDEVRGLALAIDRAVLLADDGIIDAAALNLPTTSVAMRPTEPKFDLTDAEKAMIEAALREHRHNVTHAATALGLSRGALYRRMARYGL